MTAIGVFCARVRVEEKQIIAAIDHSGLVAVPVPPASTPLPPGPALQDAAMLGEFLDATTGETISQAFEVVIDRAANRAVAAATLPLLQLSGIDLIDAGLAATGTRLQVASALQAAGIARPRSLVGFSEESSVAAAQRLGYPSTLLGLTPGSSTTHLQDADTAEAVIEHRVVLGTAEDSVMLLQAGAPSTDERTLVQVVGGQAIAITGADVPVDGLALAVQAARVLRASFAAIELARTEEGLVVWDVLPVSDFRQSRQLGDVSVAEALANLASRMISVTPVSASATVNRHGEVQHEFALSA